MPDVFTIFSRWWKYILAVVVIAVAIAASIVFLKPNLYLSMATAVPGSSLSFDKSRIFNVNIQALYTDIGLPDELDIIVGTAQLDTIYLAVTDQFNLYDHYKFSKSDGEKRQKSAIRLKKNSKIIKSDYGELKIKVLDTDRNLAPQLANALMGYLQKIHQDIQNSNNEKVLDALHKAVASVQIKIDTLNMGTFKHSESLELRRKNLLLQSEEYERLINQYEIITEATPSALKIVETARASLWPDKPRRAQIIIATAVLSLFFALLLSLFLDRRKSMN